MSLENILTQTAALEQADRAALGITHAYDKAPEVSGYWPFAVRYPSTGDLAHSRGWGKHNMHHFIIEVHIQRGLPGGLAQCGAIALPIIEAYQLLYADNLSLNDSCDRSGFDLPSWEYGELEWANEKTFGIRFYMHAKEMLDDIPVNL